MIVWEVATCAHHEKVIEDIVEKAIDRHVECVVTVIADGINVGGIKVGRMAVGEIAVSEITEGGITNGGITDGETTVKEITVGGITVGVAIGRDEFANGGTVGNGDRGRGLVTPGLCVTMAGVVRRPEDSTPGRDVGNEVKSGPVSAPEVKLSEHDVDPSGTIDKLGIAVPVGRVGKPEIMGPGAVGRAVKLEPSGSPVGIGLPNSSVGHGGVPEGPLAPGMMVGCGPGIVGTLQGANGTGTVTTLGTLKGTLSDDNCVSGKDTGGTVIVVVQGGSESVMGPVSGMLGVSVLAVVHHDNV